MRSPSEPLCTCVIAAMLLLGASAHAQQVRLLVQSTPLAGYNFHSAAAVFGAMRAGDALALVREPANPHDRNAIRVEWEGRVLGYVPRAHNAALAAALDEGAPITARISRLQSHRSPRQRVQFEVYVE